MPKKTSKPRGRPPAGISNGERVTDYPQLSVHVPTVVRDRLQALSVVTRQAQWRILSDAVDAYLARMGRDERRLVEEMVSRAQPVLARPSKGRKEPAADNALILNVDDNEAMLFARSSMLRKEGFEVVEADTGRKAIQMLASHRPNLVLLDVHLPDMNGLEVCRRIKSDPGLCHVKVIQLSATYSSPHDQLQGLETGGADIYLAEPIPRGTLLSVVRRLLAS